MVKSEIKQGTDQWHKNKLEFLGANDIACILNNGYFDKDEIIHQKIHLIKPEQSADTQRLLDRGTRYEPIVRELAAKRHGVSIKETGQRFHPEYYFITASPDGIINDKMLVEFKVRTKINDTIPFKYWIQMQIQMEVWNKESCLYCDNQIREFSSKESGVEELVVDGKTYYWQLEKYFEVEVKRDRQWFKRNIDDIKKAWELIRKGRLALAQTPASTSNQRRRKRGRADTEEITERMKFHRDRAQIITQYDLRNWIKNDPILDWLKIYGPESERDQAASGSEISNYIYEKSIKFRQHVVNYLKTHCSVNYIDIDDGPRPSPLSDSEPEISYAQNLIYYDRHEKTMAALKAETGPIMIFNAGIYDATEKLYAKADILIRSEYLNHVLPEVKVDLELPRGSYIPVLINYSTLNTRVDGKHLKSNPTQNFVKAQLAFISKCFGERIIAPVSLVICRKSEKTKNCFEAVGQVEHEEGQSEVERAIEWLRILKDPDQTAMDWDLFKPARPEMLPNMKNQQDFPWHNLKSKIAAVTKDVTLMYQHGAKKRKIVDAARWTELKDTTKTGVVAERVNNIVESNITNKILGIDKIQFKADERAPVEFFVDFEAINDMNDDFSTFPIAGGCSMIYMIGCLSVNYLTGMQEFRTYIADRLSKKHETEIVDRWISDMHAGLGLSGDALPIVFHWGDAEKTLFSKTSRGRGSKDGVMPFKFVNLCTKFKQANVAIPNVFSYGLKEVVKALHSTGKIKTTWSSNDQDGSTALVAGWLAEEYCKKNGSGTRLCDLKSIRDIAQYNYVDCKVLAEILELVTGRGCTTAVVFLQIFYAC